MMPLVLSMAATSVPLLARPSKIMTAANPAPRSLRQSFAIPTPLRGEAEKPRQMYHRAETKAATGIAPALQSARPRLMPRNERLIELYYAALSRPPGDRGRFLAEACAGDGALRAELEGLLAPDISWAGPPGRGAIGTVAAMWTQGLSVLRPGSRVGIYEVVAPMTGSDF